jgi:hypothetical protein
MVRMNGFQAGNIDAIRCERTVCVIKAGDLRAKAFQIVFGRDGSLFITFPYFRAPSRTSVFVVDSCNRDARISGES